MAALKGVTNNGEQLYEVMFTKREMALVLASLQASAVSLSTTPPADDDPLRTNKIELVREVQRLVSELQAARNKDESWRFK
jgi:hypothetical protein